jgi:RNA polymerase sigma-70 factor (ECF subfamily)
MNAIAHAWIDADRRPARAWASRTPPVSGGPADVGTAAQPAGLILAIAASADREAFAALFTQFAPRVKGYMMRLGAAPGAAEELAQETLLMVWR